MKNEILSGLLLSAFTLLILFCIVWQDNKNNPPSEIESATITTVSSSEPLEATQSNETIVSLGMFKVTHYCPCTECCDKSNGITASGIPATPNHTIAASSNIPYGTVLIINGIEYTVEDRGGAITENRIDIFVNSHDTALKMGTYEVEVFQKIN